jgi:hypothetical protein
MLISVFIAFILIALCGVSEVGEFVIIFMQQSHDMLFAHALTTLQLTIFSDGSSCPRTYVSNSLMTIANSGSYLA